VRSDDPIEQDSRETAAVRTARVRVAPADPPGPTRQQPSPPYDPQPYQSPATHSTPSPPPYEPQPYQPPSPPLYEPQPFQPSASPSPSPPAMIPPPASSSNYPAVYGTYPSSRRRVIAIVGGVIAALAVVAAGVFVATGGGGSDETGGGSESTAKSGKTDDPLRAYLLDFADRATGKTIDSHQANCMVDNVLDVFGRQRLMDAKVLEADSPLMVMKPAEVEKWVATSLDCLDDDALVKAVASTWNPERYGGLPDEIAPCIYRGWLNGWGRTRLIQVVGKMSVPGADIRKVLTKPESDISTKVVGDCNGQLQSSSTTAASGG
jgi:hypothetical protein